MTFRLSLLVGLAGVVVAAACGGGQQAEVAPQPNLDSIRRADSIRAAEEARRRAEEEARRREQAERERVEAMRRDSIAAAERLAARLRETLAQRIHFDFDRSEIRSGDAAILDAKLAILRANPNLTISIVGHADERGSDEYNLALGNRRALAARAYLVQRGIAANRITTSSMGEEQPLVAASNEDAWAQNRRAEFTITAGGTALVAPSGM